jgi:hypothetical protein
MIRFRCPKCNKKLGVNESQAGEVGVCPECKGKFRIPAAPAGDEITTSPRGKSGPPPEDEGGPAPAGGRRRREEEEDDDLPPRRRRREEEDDDDLPPRQRRREEGEDEDLPPRRRRREEEDEEERKPARRRRRRRQGASGLPGGLDGLTVGLLGVGVGGLLFVGLSLVLPAAALLPLGLGYLLAVAGSIWFLVVAFQDSPVSGLLCLCVPFYSLIYLVTHFEETKRPFFAYLTGLILVMTASCAGAMHESRTGPSPRFGAGPPTRVVTARPAAAGVSLPGA